MNNFIQEGHSLDFVAPSGGVVSGGLYVTAALVHIAATTAAEGESYAGWLEGVYSLTAETHATTQAIAKGGPVYWDASNSRATKTATGNTLIGAAAEAKVSTAATVKVRLQPSASAAGAAIADIALAAVTGVDGTGSNAASKADVDARLTTIAAKINAIIAAMEAGGVVTA